MKAARPAAGDGVPEAVYLRPGRFVDCDHPAVKAFAERAAGRATGCAPDARTRAVRLYHVVRDEVRYDPYIDYTDLDNYRAGGVLERGRGFCVGKAALLAAAARATGIPARVAFADVRNHLATPRLRALIGTDLFIYHGIAELWLDERWVKATPTFNLSLCEKFGIQPLDFDGRSDALLHPYDREGRRHMEYVRERGAYADVPAEQIKSAMHAAYPRLFALGRGPRGDFAREAEGLG